MKEMHKWKDKVEVTLDNRQIFFLFFGASVVGCFVFGLGMMAGRRIDFDLQGEGMATAQDSLAMLQTEEELEGPFAFQEGLRLDVSAAPNPVVPSAPATEPVVPPVAALVAAPEPAAAQPIPTPPPKAKPRPAATQVDKKVSPPTERAPAPAVTLASGQASPSAAPVPAGRNFTLQMKAFAKQDEADAFAAQLRSRGHDVRVESHEIKGRVWYRVRVGAFSSWSDGLAAKEAFEQKEKTIAYVVRQ